MADVKLVVEGVELPAHKTILAANSKVFADLFTSQASAAPSNSGVPQVPLVPLVGESLQDATTALTYLYRNCVPSTHAQSVASREARALIRFGHKYGMQGMLDAIESVLISYFQQDCWELIDDNADVATWTATAEKYGLRRLLAHCEDFMIKDDDESLWHDKALVGDDVSRASLLRVLRGLQHSRLKMKQGSKNCRPAEEFDADIPTLLEWQKSEEA